MKFSRLAATVAAFTLFASPALAQSFNTNTPSAWTVSCIFIGDGANPNHPACDGTPKAPVLVSPLAAGWPNASWISPVQSGSLGTAGNGENPRWQMTFSTNLTFSDVLATDIAEITVSRLLLDNYFISVALNGVAFTPNWIGNAPLAPNGSNWTQAFSFSNSITGGLVEGNNTLAFTITGNGQTDAIAIEGEISRRAGFQVPEPASMALLLVGALGIGAAQRRRTV